jgi:tetratricopeptide (TPR) repeat protein
MRRPLFVLAAALALGCHAPAPAGPAAEKAPPSPTAAAAPGGDDAVDTGPVEPWYRARAGHTELDPVAPAEDLAFTITLLDWLGTGNPDLWVRIAPRVEQAYAVPDMHIVVPVPKPDKEGAHRYHEAAAPLSARPAAERDGAAEDRLYRKAVLLDPGDPDLYTHLAIDASLRKDYAAAVRYAKLAIAIAPSFLNAYQELCYAYKNLGRYDDVVAVAERGLKLDGDLHTKAMLLARKGQALWLESKKDEAIAAFSTSRRLGGPDWVESYINGEQTLGQEFKVPPPSTPTP